MRDKDKVKERLVAELAALRRRAAALEAANEERKRAEKTLLALSRASQTVQRVHHPKAVYRTIGEQVTRLGFDATVFILNDEGTHLTIPFLTLEPHLIRVAKKLTGLSAEGYRFPLTSGGFYQQIIAGGEAVFIQETTAPFSKMLPSEMRSLADRLVDLFGWEESIFAPLIIGGEIEGLLAISGCGLTKADIPAVTAFANQAAIAMENARLYKAERDAQERLRDLASHLQDARERERKRIAREIHDELGQTLTALKFDLYQCVKEFPEDAPALRERADVMANHIDDAIRTVRHVAMELRPELLDYLGLAATIEWQAEQFSERTGLKYHLHLGSEHTRLPPDVSTALFRILQETLTNVARHAQAEEVYVELATEPHQVTLRVRDDGIGIADSDISGPQALGLLGIRERARALGGEVTFEGVRGQGTAVTVRIPGDDL